jgi:hypothetical protein
MAEFVRQVPDGDDRKRLMCRDCGHIAYENPKIVVGAVVAHEGQVASRHRGGPMTRARMAMAALLLLAAPQARAYVLLEGPMPSLGAAKAAPIANPPGFTPAPRPDPDARAPVQRGLSGPVIGPDLVNRNINRGPVGNGFVDGGGYSDQLERRGRTSTAIGNTLAPAITIRAPLAK